MLLTECEALSVGETEQNTNIISLEKEGEKKSATFSMKESFHNAAEEMS